MRWLEQLRVRLRIFARRRRVEREMDAELSFHIEQQTDENLRAGMSAEAARHSALRMTGSVMRIKEECRESLGWRVLDEWRQDVRYAVTSFRRTPGFTAVAMVTLALGIGANTAVFSAINSVLIKPLPFPDPDRFVSTRETNLRTRGNSPVSSGNFVDWQDHVQAFETVASWTFQYINVGGRDEPEQVQRCKVSAAYLPLLGAHTMAGRLFLPSEEEPGHERVAVLTEALWRRRFGSARDLIGQTIEVEGQPFTVVGILPGTFPAGRVLNRPIDIYVPSRLVRAPWTDVITT